MQAGNRPLRPEVEFASAMSITFPSYCVTCSLGLPPRDLSPFLSARRTRAKGLTISVTNGAANRRKRHWYCVSSLATAFLDVEKPQIPSLEDHSISIETVRSFTCMRPTVPPLKTDFGAILAAETFVDAELHAAAAEAVSLAKEAVEVAKNAALISCNNMYGAISYPKDLTSQADFFTFERTNITEVEYVENLGHSTETEAQSKEENIFIQIAKDDKHCNERERENEDLQMQFSKNIAVRSCRRSERRAKRERGAGKNIVNGIPMKSGPSSQKKQTSIQEIDYADPLRYLRGAANSTKLLTAAEELKLSEGIQELLKFEKIREELEERYGSPPTFVQWAVAAGLGQKTLRNRLKYGLHCKERMIKSNLRLVISIAKNYLGCGMSLQDLVQEGCRGLVKGADKFDASKGFKFSTYAHWWIKDAVRKSLSEQSRTIRLPFHIVDGAYRIKEASNQLYDQNRRHPDNKEISEATGFSSKKLMTILLSPKATRSLDQKTGIDESLKPLEVIADPNTETPIDVLMKQLMKEDLDKVLHTLNSRERQVVRWRFGVEDGRMKSLQEIGDLMSISRERVRQIESRAFRKLQNKKRTENLKQYLIS